MSTIADYIIDLLNDDMVSHGLFVQCLGQDQNAGNEPQHEWKTVLNELLSGEVEIGAAKSTSTDYVEFIAWNGTVEERIARAAESVESVTVPDKEFVYWLCLRKNVDRFEEK